MILSFLDATYIFVFRTASEVIRRALFDIMEEAASVVERRHVSLRAEVVVPMGSPACSTGAREIEKVLVGGLLFQSEKDVTSTTWSRNSKDDSVDMS